MNIEENNSPQNVKYININKELEIFAELRMMVYLIVRELPSHPTPYPTIDYFQDDCTEFFWEYCLDVGVLFETFGKGRAFVRPYNTDSSLFEMNLRILYPHQKPTHKVVLFPKRKEGIISYHRNQIISWSESDDIYLSEITPHRVQYLDQDGTLISKHGIQCVINDKTHHFSQSDCNFYLVPIDPNTTWIPKVSPYSDYPPKDRLEFTSF